MKFFKEMNVANRLTMARVFLLPFFVVFMCLSVRGGDIEALRISGEKGFIYLRWLALVVFLISAITDFLDGQIARRRHLVTDFGKFADPLADKLLVCSALVLFSAEGSLPSWVTIIIIAREFIINGIRLVASGGGTVIAASIYGKIKTNLQIFLSVYLIHPTLPVVCGPVVTWFLIGAATLATVLSLADYIVKNRDAFSGISK